MKKGHGPPFNESSVNKSKSGDVNVTLKYPSKVQIRFNATWPPQKKINIPTLVKMSTTTILHHLVSGTLPRFVMLVLGKTCKTHWIPFLASTPPKVSPHHPQKKKRTEASFKAALEFAGLVGIRTPRYNTLNTDRVHKQYKSLYKPDTSRPHKSHTRKPARKSPVTVHKYDIAWSGPSSRQDRIARRKASVPRVKRTGYSGGMSLLMVSVPTRGDLVDVVFLSGFLEEPNRGMSVVVSRLSPFIHYQSRS
jgi:hypothetical protein